MPVQVKGGSIGCKGPTFFLAGLLYFALNKLNFVNPFKMSALESSEGQYKSLLYFISEGAADFGHMNPGYCYKEPLVLSF